MNNVLVCGGRAFARLPVKKTNSLYEQVDKDHPTYPARLAEYRFIHKILYSELTTPADNPNGYDLNDLNLQIIHGDAEGADKAADEWAVVNWIPCKPYPAQWSDVQRPGARVIRRADGSSYDADAGGVRNQLMLDDGRPVLVLAFPGGSGTADMVARARRAGVPVKEFKFQGGKNG